MIGKRNRKKVVRKRRHLTFTQKARIDFKGRIEPLEPISKRLLEVTRFVSNLERLNPQGPTADAIRILRKQLAAQQHAIRLITRLIAEDIDEEYNIGEEVEGAKDTQDK